MVVREARITKDYIYLLIVSNLISLSGLKKFLCNKFRNEEILIYFIDYKYMHTLFHHTLELLLNAVTTGPLILAKLWTDA